MLCLEDILTCFTCDCILIADSLDMQFPKDQNEKHLESP